MIGSGWEFVLDVYGEMARIGLVTKLDRVALAAYCTAYARLKAAEARVAKLEAALRIDGARIMAEALVRCEAYLPAVDRRR